MEKYRREPAPEEDVYYERKKAEKSGETLAKDTIWRRTKFRLHMSEETVTDLVEVRAKLNCDVYGLRALPGDKIPYQPHGAPPVRELPANNHMHILDLVVVTAESGDVRNVPQGFDLENCRSTWNGCNFSIPRPELTFSGKTLVEPGRLKLATTYVKFFKNATVTQPLNCKSP